MFQVNNSWISQVVSKQLLSKPWVGFCVAEYCAFAGQVPVRGDLIKGTLRLRIAVSTLSKSLGPYFKFFLLFALPSQTWLLSRMSKFRSRFSLHSRQWSYPSAGHPLIWKAGCPSEVG